MEKNREYEGVVEGLGTDGEGIIKTESTTAFVPFCLTGERVRFTALKVKDGIAYGKLNEVIKKSPSRVEPICPVFGKCGGCDLQHIEYSAQLEFKKASVINALNKIGGIYTAVNDTVASEKQYGYRNKLVLPIGENGAGFYARRSHRIIPTLSCAVQAEWAGDIIGIINKFAAKTDVSALRHIVVREIGGKFIIALVATKKIEVAPLICLLERKFGEFTFLLNINPTQTNVIFGKEWIICRGEGFFGAEQHGIKYRAGANTFLQVNDGMRDKLYSAILAEAEEGCAALDLYSGGGMLTAMLAKKCGLAYGVEVVEEASRCADELKELNGLQDKMFNICGTVEEKIGEVFALTEGRKRVIVCDPPRKGMERSVVRAIARSGADKVVLVSCNPATLARDLGILTGTLTEKDGALVKTGSPVSDYEITSVTPYDMFPQSKWVETLVVLSHKKPDGRIKVNVEFGEEEGNYKRKIHS